MGAAGSAGIEPLDRQRKTNTIGGTDPIGYKAMPSVHIVALKGGLLSFRASAVQSQERLQHRPAQKISVIVVQSKTDTDAVANGFFRPVDDDTSFANKAPEEGTLLDCGHSNCAAAEDRSRLLQEKECQIGCVVVSFRHLSNRHGVDWPTVRACLAAASLATLSQYSTNKLCSGVSTLRSMNNSRP